MDYSLLSDSPLFKGMTKGEIESVLEALPHRIRKFHSEALIAQSGDPVNSLMIVMAGLVKGEMVDFGGKIIKIEDIKAPGSLAPGFMFGTKNSFPVNVVAVSEAELLIIEKADFLKLLMNNDKMLVNFLDMISNRSYFLSEKIKFLNFKTIKGKLAQYILKLAGGKTFEIMLDRTQSDLADFFGVARPSIARVLREMEEAGLIKVNGKQIKIIAEKDLTDLTRD